MPEEKPRRATIVERFDQALAHASSLRNRFAAVPRKSFAYSRLVHEALTPYRAGLDEYAALCASNAPARTLAEADAAYDRVTAALSDILDFQANAPTILHNQTILLDGSEVLHEDQPTAPGPGRKAPAPPCCITYCELEKLYDGDLHVVVTNSEGTRRERDFTKAKPIRKVWKKPVASEDDDEGTKSASGVIDGGLGRCITISIQMITTDAHGAKTYTPTPPYKIDLCCDDPAMVDGATLNRPEPPSDHPHTVSPLPLLKIKKIVSLIPCPDEVAGTGTSDHATVGSGTKKLEGVKRIDGKIFYGAWGRFIVASNRCRNIRFVQGKKRTVVAKYPGRNSSEPVPSMTKNDRYHLDVPEGVRTPEYPSDELVGGGREINDGPGVTNPWDGGPQVDEKKKPFPAGTELTITWVFRTWAVCLDSQPVVILGRFDWTVVLHLTIGADEGSSHGTVDAPKPVWTDDPDKDGYEGVARQAPVSSGFVPAS